MATIRKGDKKLKILSQHFLLVAHSTPSRIQEILVRASEQLWIKKFL
jgi:hypothetical protein